MSRFDIVETGLSGLALLERKPIGDSRGFLERLWCAEEWQALFPGMQIAQINRSYTARAGSLRGLHYQQPPHAEAKYVSCLRGEVFDVAVDLRRGSPTFLQWHAEVLSAANHRSLYIPPGFAHGFQTLSDDCEMFYIHSQPYCAQAEAGMNALDPSLAIAWPLPVQERSPRDQALPMLDSTFSGVLL